MTNSIRLIEKDIPMKYLLLFLVSAIILPAMLMLTGCSGGNEIAPQTGANGKATVRIIWPERTIESRVSLIPRVTQSVVVHVLHNSMDYSDTQTIPRPTDGTPSIVTFNSFPTGDVTISVYAYATVDGSGTAVALGSAGDTIYFNQTTSVTVDLSSTITLLSFTSIPTTILVGDNFPIVATALDPSWNIVPVAIDGFYWESSDPAIATIGALDGQFYAVSAGLVTVTVTERESGISDSFDITIY